MSYQKPEDADPFDQNINPRPEDSSTSYRDGYVEGRADKRLQQQEYNRAREEQIRENSGTNGVLFGVALTALVTLIFGTIFFLTQRNETPTQTEITVPEEETSPETETNVIERTVERTQEIVPVPQQSSPPEIDVPAPNVEINVPASEPEPSPEPATEPQEPVAEPAEPQETAPNAELEQPTEPPEPAAEPASPLPSGN